MKRSESIAVFFSLISATCRSSPPNPQFLNESARADVDRAPIVVLARVSDVKDPPHSGPSGVRPIEVSLEVRHVIKGSMTGAVACFVYFFPYGGLRGQLPAWVERDAVGVFTLRPNGSCLRAVNDSRAIMTAFKEPSQKLSTDDFIAEATMPPACEDPYRLADLLQNVSIPLLGSRHAHQLFRSTGGASDARVQLCRCEAESVAWRLPEKCSTQGAPPDHARVAEEISSQSVGLASREEQRLAISPADWLQETAAAWGIDGALMRMAFLMENGGLRFSGRTCSDLKAKSASSGFAESLRKGSVWSSRDAERLALAQYEHWLRRGCPAEWDSLENPASPQ